MYEYHRLLTSFLLQYRGVYFDFDLVCGTGSGERYQSHGIFFTNHVILGPPTYTGYLYEGNEKREGSREGKGGGTLIHSDETHIQCTCRGKKPNLQFPNTTTYSERPRVSAANTKSWSNLDLCCWGVSFRRKGDSHAARKDFGGALDGK